jgi:tetratricopeptide (TPR) repeat protein
MFEKAIEVDPGYALAHAALADTISLERMYYPAGAADMPVAERASRRALELDPTLAEAHSARASVLFQMERYAEAEIEFRTAQRLDPRLYEAHYFFARMCFQTGRLEEAAASFARAYAVRADYQAAFFAGQALEALGRHGEACRHYEFSEVAAASHMELNPDDARAATCRAVALCRTGRQAEGLEWGERAVGLDPVDAGVRYNVACLYAVAGRPQDALRYVEEVVRLGFGNRGWLERDPDLDSIRDLPRFQELLQQMEANPDQPVISA